MTNDEKISDITELRKMLPRSFPVGGMPDWLMIFLYERFCTIQAAIWLIVDQPTANRFELWVKTGDDEDAWS